LIDTNNADYYTILEEVAKKAAALAIQEFAASSPLNLENLIPDNEHTLSCDEGKESIMKKLRQRVYVNGVEKWVTGENMQEVLVAAAYLLASSGCIPNFQEKTSDQSPLFQEYAISWYETYKIPKLRPATAHQYKMLLDNHLIPFFYNKRLGEIVSSDVQALYNQKSEEGMSKSTAHTMKVILNQIYCSAIEDKLVNDNPICSKRLTLPSKKKEKGALSEEELADIISGLQKLELKDRRFLALLIYTGMRRGEALGLKWSDINWEKKLIHIERTASYIDNDTYVAAPKTPTSIRDVPLCSALANILCPDAKEGYIFCSGDKPISKSSMTKMWRRIGRTIDLHGATPHTFRHTFISTAIGAGVDPTTVQGVAGHSTVAITMNIYSHTTKRRIQNAAEIIEQKMSDFQNMV